jgi:hypothetical protein
MSNYTKEELEGKVKRDLIAIAKELNIDSTGNRSVLIDRIFDHKPSFEEMVDSAPVSKNGDLTIEIEEKAEEDDEDIPIGVEVNDAYPEQNEEIEEDRKYTEAEVKVEAEVKTEELVKTEPAEITAAAVPPLEKTTVPTNMVAENTADDILKGWQGAVQNFYRKNTPGFAPSRPATPATIAGQLGVPESTGVLAGWQASIISRLRPVRGAASPPPKTVKDMIQIIKSL